MSGGLYVDAVTGSGADLPATGSGPVAPLSFGTVLEDEAGVARFLRERGEALRAALDRLRGAVELAVQATIPNADGPRIGHALKTGREYMNAFFTRVTELEREGVAAALVCTGPCPPYTFSE